ncbi:hypothetical protein D3C71_1304630 [compost metagenome]
MKNIGHRYDFGIEMDLTALKPERISGPVHLLMVLKRCKSDAFIDCRDVPKNLIAISRMSAHLIPFCRCKSPWIIQNGRIYLHIADVVQEPCKSSLEPVPLRVAAPLGDFVRG